jgi:hypothetical protein
MTRSRTLLAALLLAPLAAACFADPAGPELIIDPVMPLRLSAVSANGSALPASVPLSSTGSQGHVFTSAQLVISGSDSLQLVIATRPTSYLGAALWLDTLRAHVRSHGDSIIVTPMGSHRFAFNPRGNFGQDGSLIFTLRDVTLSSDGSTITTPVTLLFPR